MTPDTLVGVSPTKPISDVVILVPRRADNGVRDRLWRFTRSWWAREFPDWAIVEGHHDDGPFNRSAAINSAAEAAGDWNVAIIIDGDVLPTTSAIHAAVALARQDIPVSGFNLRRHLTKQGTELVLAGSRKSWTSWVKQDFKDSVSGAYVLSHDVWNAVGGFDESFVGWGWEDVAFKIATETMAGKEMARTTGYLWHLWHPTSPERDETRPEYKANRERAKRYRAARMNKAEMAKILAETQNVTHGFIDPVRWETTIPPILHRTVPEQTSDEVEEFWNHAKALHPGWEYRTWRDPLDPKDFPETSHLWERCRSGAQMAGLIRLEVLWHHGGVYVDSDVEVYRPFDALLGLSGVAAWEDAKVVPDAIMGFAPHHPAVAQMLELACASVERGEGAWLSGPGVTTSVLPNRSDVLLLPPGSWYEIHYTEKENLDREPKPYELARHHWHHSWKGK